MPAMICERCGWFVPADCTCLKDTDRIAAAALAAATARRHRQSVARARASGWAVDGGPVGNRWAAA